MLLVSRPHDSEEGVDVSEVIVHTLKPIGLVVELGQAMSRAMHDSEDLRHGQQEVEDLWQEEKDHGLREVPQNTHHGKGHACKVAEGVTHEDLGWELVMLQETQSHKNEGDDDS